MAPHQRQSPFRDRYFGTTVPHGWVRYGLWAAASLAASSIVIFGTVVADSADALPKVVLMSCVAVVAITKAAVVALLRLRGDRNIEAAKAAAKLAEDQERTLRGVFDAAPVMMGILEVNQGRLIHLSGNSASSRFFKTDPGESPDMPPSITSLWLAKAAECERTGRAVRLEYEHPIRGVSRWIDASFAPLDPAPGEQPRFIYVADDVSTRRAAEQNLVLSESRYRAIVEDQTELICRWKPGGVLTFVNEAYCRYFGMSRQQLIGRTFTPVIAPDDLPTVQSEFDRITVENPIGTTEHRVVLPSGAIRWQRWVNRGLFHPDGSIREYQSTGRDITTQKDAQEGLLTAYADMRRMLSREENLRRELNHRVRNNLSGLLGLVGVYERSGRGTKEVAQGLRGKIYAMKEVHDVISASDWKSVGLRAILDRLSKASSDDLLGRLATVSGDDIEIPAAQAPALAMVLQELFTNSRKHGALGVVGGSVSITWIIGPSTAAGTTVQFQWVESGLAHKDDSSVDAANSGVGLGLVVGLARSELRGEAVYHFGRTGARWDLIVTVEHPAKKPESRAVAAEPSARQEMDP